MLLFSGYFATSLSICFLHCVSKNAWNFGTNGFSGADVNSSNAIHQIWFFRVFKQDQTAFPVQGNGNASLLTITYWKKKWGLSINAWEMPAKSRQSDFLILIPPQF